MEGLVPLIPRDAFIRALQNIYQWGDTDVFPLPIEGHVLRDKEQDVVALLEAMASDFDNRLNTSPPANYSALAPVGYNGFRWATQLDPLCNAYLLGLVIAIAPDIEQHRIPPTEQIVFSYRYSPNGDGSLFTKTAWHDFQERSRQLATDAKYVVAVDIADFYARIYHHRIENELRSVDRNGSIARQITRLLKEISNNVSYGLPVGGPAARILSELLLNATDKLILSLLHGIPFTRYADDYRFFVPDQEAAYRCIGTLSELLQQNEGLSLQRAKTRVFTSAEFLAASAPEGDPRPGSAAKFLGLNLYYDPYSPTRDADYETLKEQLAEFDVVALLRAELFKGRVDPALTRRLVRVIQHLAETPRVQALKSLLDNIDTLAPVMPQVLKAIRDSLDGLSDDMQEDIQARVRELVESKKHVTQVPVNFAYLVRVLAHSRSTENENLLIRLFGAQHGYAASPAPNVQRDIVLVMARWGATYWLRGLKGQWSTMHAWVQRAFFIASYSMGDEGRHWREANRRRLGEFDMIVADWRAAKAHDDGWQIPI